MNCPRCNMIIAQGAQVCPNCQLNLQQAGYQQHAHFGMPPVPALDAETRNEKLFKKLLLISVIVQMSEYAVYRLWEYSDMSYSWLTPLEWLSNIAWAGWPLLVALLFPKAMNGRVVLIVFASLYAVWKLGTDLYYEFLYDPMNYDYNF